MLGDKSASYFYVNPGNYVFKIMIFNNDGVKVVKTLAIHIDPPWWKTSWAYTVYVLLVAGMLAGARRAIIQRERLKSNLKLEQLEREKKHVELEKSKEIDRMKTTFFTNISHEFRTPLTLIKGPAQNLLAEFSSRPTVKKQVKLIQHNADLLLNLVNQLLDLAKLEAGTVEVNAIKVDLNAFLNMIIDSFSSHAKEKEIDLQYKFPEIRYQVSLDKDKVGAIITNLLGNAVKFTSSGGHVDLNAKVNVTDSPKVAQLVVTVSDTGIGIPTEDQIKIFERFYQVNEGGAHKEIGSGIGLALVKELTELLGGKVMVKSEPEKGSEFGVAIPLQIIGVIDDVESPEPREMTEVPDADEIREESGKTKLMVVEDNAELRSFIISSLNGDYSFCEAGDGKAAIEIALQEIPELIISDVMMPEMDGITMTSKLKKDIRTSHIPIILLTAKATDQAKITGLTSGADDYLVKPFNNDELILKVRNMIESRNRVREKVRIAFMREGPTMEAISADEKLLQKVKEAILNRLSDEQLSVDSLAEEIGLSRAHFYRKVTALTGLPVNELIRSFRLERAAQLLTRQWGPVSQVAFEVGYSNPSYFSKRFKDKFGVLPSEYPLKKI
jgi:signal transduction histidine kinase/DNA-binding response OmpR family regulator